MANYLEKKIEELIEELKLQDEISLKEFKEIIYNEQNGSRHLSQIWFYR